MKKLSAIPLALTFTGCFLGAGYVSGQEPYQFFGAFGVYGIIGLFVSVAFLALMNGMIVKIVCSTDCPQIDKTVVGYNNKFLLFSVGVLENIIFFGSYIVMAAGAGALVKKLVGGQLSYIIGSFVFCMAISFIAIKGIRGLVRIFSGAVPILVVMTFAVGVAAIIVYGRNGFSFAPLAEFNPFIPNWVAGAVTFASYNLFCSIGVLCPVALQIKSRKSAYIGTILGCIFLILVAFSVMFSMAVLPESQKVDLPMLVVAESISPVLMYIYAFLLFISMAGASLACLIPTVTYLAQYSKTAEKHSASVTFILSGIAFVCSCFGFADLVGTLFSSFGYISLMGVAGLTWHYIRVRK